VSQTVRSFSKPAPSSAGGFNTFSSMPPAIASGDEVRVVLRDPRFNDLTELVSLAQ
jgi:hypothetical protein